MVIPERNLEEQYHIKKLRLLTIELDKRYMKSLKNETFIDLFCGIGGFRLILESFGAECVFGIDIDKYSSKTCADNFKDNPLGDIKEISKKDIPRHYILCAGFPCQAFSICGKQKGFKDSRGALFFDIGRIARYQEPEILFSGKCEKPPNTR